MNSGGAKCEHNWVKQDALVSQVLTTIRECALPKENELRKILREINAKDSQSNGAANFDTLKKAQERQNRVVQKALESISLAQDEDERQGLRQIYRRERAKLEGVAAELRQAQSPMTRQVSNNYIEEAVEELRSLRSKLDVAQERAEIAELFRSLNARVWLTFKKVMWGKRALNRLDKGIVCIGNAPDPVDSDSLSKVHRGDWI